MKKFKKLNKEQLKKLAEALKNRRLKKIKKKTEKTELKKELKNSKLIEEEQKTGNFLTNSSSEKSRIKENKFITPDLARGIDNLNFSLPRSRSESEIALEKISPVLKPVAKAQEGLEQISSSFLLQKKSKENQDKEKLYEFEKQKYFSQSGEYKTIEKIQTENLQNPGVERGMIHMGIEQATKRKSEKFFDEKQEQKYSADIKPLEEVKEKRKDKFYVPR